MVVSQGRNNTLGGWWGQKILPKALQVLGFFFFFFSPMSHIISAIFAGFGISEVKAILFWEGKTNHFLAYLDLYYHTQ